MATVVMGEPEGVTLEVYEAMNALMEIEARPPVGLIVHTAGIVDGKLRIVDVWESPAAYERFREGRLMPAIAAMAHAAGAEPPTDEESRGYMYEASNFVMPAHERAVTA